MQSFQTLFGERSLGRPAGFVQGGSLIDSEDMQVAPAGDHLGDLAGVRLAIAYLDSRMENTRRFVVVRGVTRTNNVFYLHAHCELRNAHRTFRIDRIVEVVDMRTGEVHDNPRELFSDLILVANATAPRKSRRSRPDPTERLIAESEHGLTVLLYFAQSDEKLRRGERAVIWEYLEWQKHRCSIDGRVARRPLNAWMDTLLPDTEQFVAALHNLLGQESIHSLHVLAQVPEIVMADGKASDEEKQRLLELLRYMERQNLR